MKNPDIKTIVKHSETKSAWNVVGTKLGTKYKICRIPYVITDDDKINEENRVEAYQHAQFISACFNHSNSITDLLI